MTPPQLQIKGLTISQKPSWPWFCISFSWPLWGSVGSGKERKALQTYGLLDADREAEERPNTVGRRRKEVLRVVGRSWGKTMEAAWLRRNDVWTSTRLLRGPVLPWLFLPGKKDGKKKAKKAPWLQFWHCGPVKTVSTCHRSCLDLLQQKGIQRVVGCFHSPGLILLAPLFVCPLIHLIPFFT